MRPYTPVAPVTEEEDCGCLEFVIKIYAPGNRPGGVMTSHLESLQVGETVRIKGAAGPILYHGHGVLTINGLTVKTSKVSMIAGGTGITPMFQLMRAIHANPDDKTEIALLFSNKSENDVLLFDELNALVCDTISVWFTISKINDDSTLWKYSVGYVNEHMMREHLFDPTDATIALVCGPPVMLQRACLPELMRFGYSESNIFEF